MANTRLIETGEIVRPHGVRGEVRVKPWANGPKSLLGFERLYIDGDRFDVRSARVHGDIVIIAFDGVTDVSAAEKLKGKTVFLNRADAGLEDGEHFIADLIGLRAVDIASGRDIGLVSDIARLPAGAVYTVTDAEGRERLIPGNPEFVREIDMDGGIIRFALIEGM
jgi:16S rRNA processing protein RimM